MKKLTLIFAAVTMFFTSCEEFPHVPSNGEGRPGPNLTKKYSADVAIQWVNLQQRLIKSTPGFDPLVASRSFAYSGLALYESVLKGMPAYVSVASPRIGTNINEVSHQQIIHWPASANAAMAFMLKNLFANTSASNQTAIDSLESTFNSLFHSESSQHIVTQSAEYGRKIANQIFEWSKTDGGHEAYLQATSDTYIPPTGPGKWIPTPPANSKPIRPYWGDNRSFVAGSALGTMPPPPPAYSETAESGFYKMAQELYSTSRSLSEEDIRIVKHWADLPGNYGTPAHYTHIATQLIEKNRFRLDQAAIVYAKHGIALNEAIINVFKAKYTYNLIRPVSYIRNVLGYTDWNTVIGTPPHPEYPSAHAVLGGASAAIMESFVGKNYSFVDRTHENLYGARTYESLRAYAEEASKSRVLGGIHYNVSAAIGLMQGEEVGKLVNDIGFKGNPSNTP
jgi:hypothetical protein